jgi:hypothetical protein
VTYILVSICKIAIFFVKVSIAGRSPDDRLSIKRDKNHILFGGTKILQHTADKVLLMMHKTLLILHLCLIYLTCLALEYSHSI